MSYTSEKSKYLLFVDPNKLSGFSLTGTSKKKEYKELILPLKQALSDYDYVFSSILQVYKKGAIENEFPTLAIAFDEKKTDSQEKYENFLKGILQRIEPIIEQSRLTINLAILDRRENFLKFFKEPTSWIIDIKDEDIYEQSSRPWWQFW